MHKGCTQQILQFCNTFQFIIKPPSTTQDTTLRVDKLLHVFYKYNNFSTLFSVPQDGLKMNQKMWNKSRSCYKQPLWTLMVDWSNSIQTECVTVLHMFYAILCKYCINYYLFYFSSQCTSQLLSISTSYPTTVHITVAIHQHILPHHSAHHSCYPSAHPTPPPMTDNKLFVQYVLSNVCSHLPDYTIPHRTPQSKPQYVPSPRLQNGNRIKGPDLQLWTNLWYGRNSEVLITVNVSFMSLVDVMTCS